MQVPSPQFARDIVRLADKYYSDWRVIIWRSFVSGIFTALGATVGLAIVLGLVGLIFNGLGFLPVVGDFFVKLNAVLDTYRPSS